MWSNLDHIELRSDIKSKLTFTVIVSFWFPVSRIIWIQFFLLKKNIIKKMKNLQKIWILGEIVCYSIILILKYEIWVYNLTKTAKHIQIFVDGNVIAITNFFYAKLRKCNVFNHYLIRPRQNQDKITSCNNSCWTLYLIKEICSTAE